MRRGEEREGMDWELGREWRKMGTRGRSRWNGREGINKKRNIRKEGVES